MNPGFIEKTETLQTKLGQSLGHNTKLFSIIFACLISISLLSISYAQTSPILEEQVTLSGDLLNDPVAQDLLKKIEQTKKMIEKLKQKEYQQNQAQENLQKMREISIERLNHDLNEWERIWEKHSSKNSFERFVNKKPSYVQGVFWDQFEFKEQKVNAGRIAMNEVLMNGGTMLDAKNAYNKAAATKKIELIEMNSQFNVKHNLASFAEQQVFNSTGQIHLSAAIQEKLSKFYADYKLQPNYIMANSDDLDVSDLISNVDENTRCGDGMMRISNIISGHQTCIDESTAKKWADIGVKGLVIHGDDLSEISSVSDMKTNPGTTCQTEHIVIYDLLTSEYRCVLESVAHEMVEDDTAAIHTLTKYILNKDEQKITEDKIYEINQDILRATEEYEIKRKILNSKYDDRLENENSLSKQKMREIIQEYKNSSEITKEDVTKHISEIRDSYDSIKEKILKEKSNATYDLKLELKNYISKVVQGHENNPDIDVDWIYLDNESGAISMNHEEDEEIPHNMHSLDQNINKILLKNADVVNSFGQRFDEIKSNQILQVAADITNPDEHVRDFVYVVEITNEDDVLVQPAKWMTGILNPNQTLNVGLSWIPEEDGMFNATISIGSDMNSVLPVTDIEIDVNFGGDIHGENYCKNDHELLFKYSDNSPICATPETASKLIHIGLAFA